MLGAARMHPGHADNRAHPDPEPSGGEHPGERRLFRRKRGGRHLFDTTDEALAVTNPAAPFRKTPIGCLRVPRPASLRHRRRPPFRSRRAEGSHRQYRLGPVSFRRGARRGTNPYENVVGTPGNVASLDVAWTATTAVFVTASLAVVGGNRLCRLGMTVIFGLQRERPARCCGPAQGEANCILRGGGERHGLISAVLTAISSPSTRAGRQRAVGTSPRGAPLHPRGGGRMAWSISGPRTASCTPSTATTGPRCGPLNHGANRILPGGRKWRRLCRLPTTSIWMPSTRRPAPRCGPSLRGTPLKTSPSVANGLVYVGSDDKKLYAFEATTATRKWSIMMTGPIESPRWWRMAVVYVARRPTFCLPSTQRPAPRCGNKPLRAKSFPSRQWPMAWSISAPTTTVCTPSTRRTGAALWAATTGGGIESSPVFSNGMV